MRRARLEGRHIGQRPLEIDRVAILRDRNRGDSLTNIAKTHRVSRATVSRLLNQAKDAEPVINRELPKKGSPRPPRTPLNPDPQNRHFCRLKRYGLENEPRPPADSS